MMKTAELKPCPFCGSSLKYIPLNTYEAKVVHEFEVEPSVCGFQGIIGPPLTVIRLANQRRKPNPPPY